jgi:hypothetical protein
MTPDTSSQPADPATSPSADPDPTATQPHAPELDGDALDMITVEIDSHRIVVACSRHDGWSVSLGAYSVQLPVVLRAAINHVSAEHGAYPRPRAWRSGSAPCICGCGGAAYDKHAEQERQAARGDDVRPAWAAPQDVYPIVTTAHAELDDEPPADYGVQS